MIMTGTMNRGQHRRVAIAAVVTLCALVSLAQAPAPPPTGPQTESRFPPLDLPADFKATLFACDPLVEYPSVIALGPRPGTVFVAHDYVTGLGVEIVRRDEIRLLEDTDADGYADKSTVYAGGFNSIQGLAYHAGTVFAMHAPFLTALKDTDGDGVADERRDLLAGLGLPPEKNDSRLHCANGVAVGHDGWLYLAMGDNGTDVIRPEGDRLLFQAGGILRCRPDGRDLHVFATGLRNIYDIALDEELNVFVRDNENDGGDYMIRVCHSFHGADHGYPYLYYERPDEAMPPLADLGRGSSAGGACYLETAFPPEFRGNLFFCEWGRAVVRYERERASATFAPMKESQFAAASAGDPYGLKPTDAIVDRDGSLLVSDWGDGQRPQRGRGRIYRIDPTRLAAGGHRPSAVVEPARVPDGVLAQLDSPSYYARVAAQDALIAQGPAGLQMVNDAVAAEALGPLARMHAVWIITRVAPRDCLPELFALAGHDADPRVRAQAVRAIADLSDPALNPGSTALPPDRPGTGATAGLPSSALPRTAESAPHPEETARRLAELVIGQDPRVVFEIVIALGRLRWNGAPHWLAEHLTEPDAALAHAAMQTLRRSDNWPAVLALLDRPDEHPIRPIVLRALANRADPIVVDGLIERLASEADPQRRQSYADLLTRVYKKPGPWSYWGYRPPPRPPNSVGWERTDAIEAVLDRVLSDSNRAMSAAILERMQREQVPVRLATLDRWLDDDRNSVRVRIILESLSKFPAEESRDILARLVVTADHALENRRTAFAAFAAGLDSAARPRLLDVANRVDDGPMLVGLLAELGKWPEVPSGPFILAKLDSADAAVRAAAVDASAALKLGEAASRVTELLNDPDAGVRRAAAAATGALAIKDAAPRLSELARDDDPAVRGASLASLRQLRSPSAVAEAVAALDHPASQSAAVDYLAEFGETEHAAALAKAAVTSRSVDVVSSAVRALTTWEIRPQTAPADREKLAATLAEIQGRCGTLLCWRVAGPLTPAEFAVAQQPSQPLPDGARTLLAAGPEDRVDLDAAASAPSDAAWLAISDVAAAETARAQFLASSNGPLEILINGRTVFRRDEAATFRPDADRFETDLEPGINRVAVRLAATKPATFHVRFRPLSSSAENERLVQLALQSQGDAERGRTLFLNAEKSTCLKCHRVGAQGSSTIGPDLTGVGERFSRIHIVESILEPSRNIAPSYETVTVLLTSGRVLSGVKVAENESMLVLGDEKGDKHEIPKGDIDERSTQARSTMPDGLARQFTDPEFLDLIAFLVSQKKPQQP